MYKFIKKVACTLLVLALIPTVCFAENSSPAFVQAVVTVTNSSTGDSKTLAVPVKLSSKTFRNGDGSQDAVCQVYIPIDDGVSLFTVEGGSKESGGVTANLSVNYTMSSNGEVIKVNKVYGGWVPSKSMYTVSNRVAGVHSGTFLGKRMEKYPTSNTFSYTTGWGYNMMNYDNDCAPRCWSDATVRVAGMSGTHDITVEFTYGMN